MAFAVTVPSVRAKGTLTLASVVNTNAIVVGERTYTFVTTPAAAGDIDVGGTDTATAANLVLAINGTGTPGATTYFAGTAQPDAVTASSSGAVVTVVSKIAGGAGNAIQLRQTSGATVTVGQMAGGVGAGVVEFLNSVLSLSQVNGEVFSHIKRLLGDSTSIA